MSIWSRNADSDLVVLEGLHALKHALRFGAEVLDAVALDPGAALALASGHLEKQLADDG